MPMRAVFISYRRDDSEGQAGRLYDDLARRFGRDAVFMDVAAIEPGFDFRKIIDQSVASCSVLLALMGPAWVDAKDETGRRRLDNPTDFVRLETASALKRDIPVIPVLVHGARVPRAEQLPEDLQELAYRRICETGYAVHAKLKRHPETRLRRCIMKHSECQAFAPRRPVWGFLPASPASVCRSRSAVVLGSLASAVSGSR